MGSTACALNSPLYTSKGGLFEDKTWAEEPKQRRVITRPSATSHTPNSLKQSHQFYSWTSSKALAKCLLNSSNPWQKILSKQTHLYSTVVHSTSQEYVHSLLWWRIKRLLNIVFPKRTISCSFWIPKARQSSQLNKCLLDEWYILSRIWHSEINIKAQLYLTPVVMVY